MIKFDMPFNHRQMPDAIEFEIFLLNIAAEDSALPSKSGEILSGEL